MLQKFKKKNMFLQSLRAKNNKSSCEALRLRTKFRGVNYPSLSLSLIFQKYTFSYQKYIVS